MSNISFIGSPSTGISAVIKGKAYTVTADNPHANEIWQAIMRGDSEEQVIQLFDMAAAIKGFMRGNIEIVGDQFFYKGFPIHNVVVDRIMAFMQDNLPVDPLFAFIERLMNNPSKRAVKELYTFLEREHLPITTDGYFLGYKGVREDYTDSYTGKVDNHVGQSPEMPRNMVDDNFGVSCSEGYHVGSLEYSTHFGARTVIVKVDPADVVSVPQDQSCDKLRCCKYQVVSDYEGPLRRPLHRSDHPYAGDYEHGDPARVDFEAEELSEEERLAEEDARRLEEGF